jgi:hypothetical protein
VERDQGDGEVSVRIGREKRRKRRNTVRTESAENTEKRKKRVMRTNEAIFSNNESRVG